MSDIEYKLYKNPENYGIVVVPGHPPTPSLDSFIDTMGFEHVESGKAVVRSGTKGDDETEMMPLEVQEKHKIEKFIIFKVLPDLTFMVGINEPEWGLTLAEKKVLLGEVKNNLPKTLDIFRGPVKEN